MAMELKKYDSQMCANWTGTFRSWFGAFKKYRALFLLSTTLLLAACGGGGSSSDGSTVSDGPLVSGGVNDLGSGTINGGLTGRIITTQDKLPFEFDLRTGRSKLFALNTVQSFLEGDGEVISTGEPYYFTSTRSGSSVQSGEECFDGDFNTGADDDSCYATYDANLTNTSFLRLRDVVTDGAVRMSESERFVAFSEIFRNVNDEIVAITTILDWEARARFATFRRVEPTISLRAPVFVWGQNGEFVFTGVGDNEVAFIEISNENNFNQSRLITLPNTSLYRNSIATIDLSPAGDRLVFVIDGAVRILDLNTLSITQPVTAQVGDFRQARWSPDGSMLMVMRKTNTPPPVVNFDFTVTALPSSESLYAVFADVTEPVDIDSGSLDSFIVIQSESLDQPGNFTTRFPGDSLFVVPTYDWLPE